MGCVCVSSVFTDVQPLLELTSRWVLEAQADPWVRVVRYLPEDPSVPVNH